MLTNRQGGNSSSDLSALDTVLADIVQFVRQFRTVDWFLLETATAATRDTRGFSDINESLHTDSDSLNLLPVDRVAQHREDEQDRANDAQCVAQLLTEFKANDVLSPEGVHECQAMLADLRVTDLQHIFKQDVRRIMMSVMGKRSEPRPVRQHSAIIRNSCSPGRIPAYSKFLRDARMHW